LQERFLASGGRLLFISGLDPLQVHAGGRIREVGYRSTDGEAGVLEARWVISTIPLDALYSLVRPVAGQPPPPPFELRWRGLRLLHLVTPDKTLGPEETYYFPEGHIPFGRVSELNKYSPALNGGHDGAVLTVEIPCSEGDPIWDMADDQLAGLCVSELRRLEILASPATERAGEVRSFSQKLRNVYPVYDLGWKERFEEIHRRVDAVENLYLIGRAALFLHCNMDHCMLMAIKLARHLSGRHPAKDEWDRTRREFSTYRVRE
jgi:UDP-galactopyranose mutase